MVLSRLPLFLVCLFAVFSLIVALCDQPTPSGTIEIPETKGVNEILFSISLTNSVVSFTVNKGLQRISDVDFNTYVKLITVSPTLVNFVIANTLDLDSYELFDNTVFLRGTYALNLSVEFSCKDTVTKAGATFKRGIIVKSVDEYLPTINDYTYFSISEDAEVNSLVILLPKGVYEQDLADAKMDSYTFKIWPYVGGAQRDAMFFLKVGPNGQALYLEKEVDYERGDTEFVVNVSGIQTRTGYSFNNVMILLISNINDNSPRFVYNSTIDEVYKTSISDLSPLTISSYETGDLMAVDLDGDQIYYSLVGGSPFKFSDYLEIAGRSGEIKIKEHKVKGVSTMFVAVVKAETIPWRRFPINKPKINNCAYAIVIIRTPLTLHYSTAGAHIVTGSLLAVLCGVLMYVGIH